jgi:hypothetical protein
MGRTITLDDGTRARTFGRDGLYVANDDDGRYRRGSLAVAWYVCGDEIEQKETYDDDGEYLGWDVVPTGRLVVCMVGDDRLEACDREDLEPIADDDYCSECGQIGCHHDGR